MVPPLVIPAGPPAVVLGATPDYVALMTVTIDRRALWAWVSVALIAIGSLGTWASLGIITVSGADNDGMLTLGLAAAAAASLATDRWRPVIPVAAILTLAIGIYDASEIAGTEVLGTSFDVGWGLVLVNLAAASLLVWTIADRRRRKNGSRDIPPAVDAGAADQ